MKRSIFVFCLITILVFAGGCAEEHMPGPVTHQITDGAYILSEGTNASNSKLSFYSVVNDSFYQSIYSGSLAYPDGLMLLEGNLYLVEQGPVYGGNGKLYKLDSAGNTLLTSAPFGSSPYSLGISYFKVYVTNGPGSNVSVFDYSTLNLIKEIGVGVYPQEILATVNKVFVCNTSAYNGQSDSTVSVINSLTDSISAVITLRKDPTSITESFENNANIVYAGCQGGGGMIYKIDWSSLNKLDSFSLSNGFDKDMVYHNGSIYYISALNNIDKLDLASRTVSTVVMNPGSGAYFYGYNFDEINLKHYVLDAKNFQANGSLNIYSSSGSLERSFTAGVGPRRVVFKKGTAYGGS
jgi:YVTN family beta-propeller protein